MSELLKRTLFEIAKNEDFDVVLQAIYEKCINDQVRDEFHHTIRPWMMDLLENFKGQEMVHNVHLAQEEHLRGTDQFCYALILTKPDKARAVWKFNIMEEDRLASADYIRGDFHNRPLLHTIQ